LSQIGAWFSISGERVRQLLKLAGLTKKDGGVFVRPKLIKPLTNKTCQELGISLDEYRKIKSIRPLPISRYRAHKRHAECRGIGWEITFPQWWEIWEKSAKYSLRGRGRGKYSMCRFGDIGPYKKDNVFIGESIENLKKFYALKRKPRMNNQSIGYEKALNRDVL